jgi:hypothetical protein
LKSPPTVNTPALSALMCDGLGWFSETDFKRALLLYDRIMYLVPSRTVEFRDADGRSNFILIPNLQETGFQLQHYEPEEVIREGLARSAQLDAERSTFAAVVSEIPAEDRLYTWRIANADADLGRGASVGLSPDEEALAHALLLNKFLLAADLLDAVPITGKRYIHALIGDKYQIAKSGSGGPTGPNSGVDPVAVQVINAIVPEEELERRSVADILEYKDKHRDLFYTFSYAIRRFVKQVSALPGSPDFNHQVRELISTEVWRETREVEQELRNAWAGFFKSAIKSAIAGAVTLGITPFLSLGSLSFASVLAGVAGAAPWATSELFSVLERRRQAKQHGMYYLMNFNS